MEPRFIWAMLIAGAAACKGKGDDSTTGESDADTDADTDTDTDTDTDADTDCAGKVAGTASFDVYGNATIDPWKTYAGTETRSYIALDGPRKGKDPFCKINYTFTSTAVRKDCIGDPTLDCTKGWAFDLVVSDAAIDAEYSDCDAILCGADVSTLNGATQAYAYGIYIGHPNLLAEYSDAKKSWVELYYATWDEKAGTFSYTYDREDVDYYE